MRYLIWLMFSLLSVNATAGVFTGKIEKMIIGREGHQVYVHMKDAPQTCGKDHNLGFNYALSLRDHGAGREILSALLAAQLARRKVTIQGSGACSVDSFMEDIGYIYTLN